MNPTIRVRFDHSMSACPLGTYNGRNVSQWGGWPKADTGETWECNVITEWSDGMVVSPLKKISEGERFTSRVLPSLLTMCTYMGLRGRESCEAWTEMRNRKGEPRCYEHQSQ